MPKKLDFNQNFEYDDETLIALYKEGEGKALEMLISRYLVPSYRYIAIYVKDADMREDVVQQAVIRLWRKLHLYDDTKAFKPWYFTLLKNVLFDELRKKGTVPFSYLDKEYEGEADSFESHIESKESDVESLVASLHDNEEVEKYIETLPKEKQEVMLLHLYQELTFQEISDMTGVSINTLKSTYRRTLEGMKKALEGKINT